MPASAATYIPHSWKQGFIISRQRITGKLHSTQQILTFSEIQDGALL